MTIKNLLLSVLLTVCLLTSPLVSFGKPSYMHSGSYNKYSGQKGMHSGSYKKYITKSVGSFKKGMSKPSGSYKKNKNKKNKKSKYSMEEIEDRAKDKKDDEENKKILKYDYRKTIMHWFKKQLKLQYQIAKYQELKQALIAFLNANNQGKTPLSIEQIKNEGLQLEENFISIATTYQALMVKLTALSPGGLQALQLALNNHLKYFNEQISPQATNLIKPEEQTSLQQQAQQEFNDELNQQVKEEADAENKGALLADEQAMLNQKYYEEIQITEFNNFKALDLFTQLKKLEIKREEIIAQSISLSVKIASEPNASIKQMLIKKADFNIEILMKMINEQISALKIQIANLKEVQNQQEKEQISEENNQEIEEIVQELDPLEEEKIELESIADELEVTKEYTDPENRIELEQELLSAQQNIQEIELKQKDLEEQLLELQQIEAERMIREKINELYTLKSETDKDILEGKLKVYEQKKQDLLNLDDSNNQSELQHVQQAIDIINANLAQIQSQIDLETEASKEIVAEEVLPIIEEPAIETITEEFDTSVPTDIAQEEPVAVTNILPLSTPEVVVPDVVTYRAGNAEQQLAIDNDSRLREDIIQMTDIPQLKAKEAEIRQLHTQLTAILPTIVDPQSKNFTEQRLAFLNKLLTYAKHKIYSLSDIQDSIIQPLGQPVTEEESTGSVSFIPTLPTLGLPSIDNSTPVESQPIEEVFTTLPLLNDALVSDPTEIIVNDPLVSEPTPAIIEVEENLDIEIPSLTEPAVITNEPLTIEDGILAVDPTFTSPIDLAKPEVVTLENISSPLNAPGIAQVAATPITQTNTIAEPVRSLSPAVTTTNNTISRALSRRGGTSGSISLRNSRGSTSAATSSISPRGRATSPFGGTTTSSPVGRSRGSRGSSLGRTARGVAPTTTNLYSPTPSATSSPALESQAQVAPTRVSSFGARGGSRTSELRSTIGTRSVRNPSVVSTLPTYQTNPTRVSSFGARGGSRTSGSRPTTGSRSVSNPLVVSTLPTLQVAPTRVSSFGARGGSRDYISQAAPTTVAPLSITSTETTTAPVMSQEDKNILLQNLYMLKSHHEEQAVSTQEQLTVDPNNTTLLNALETHTTEVANLTIQINSLETS